MKIRFTTGAMMLAALVAAERAAAQTGGQLALPPEGTIISEVRVEGVSRLKPTDVTRVMELEPGDPFNREAYRRDIQSITDTGKVDPLELQILWDLTQDNRLVLTVKVQENPVVDTISIVGNSRFKQKRLLTQLDYKPGDLLPTGARAATARNLRDFYSRGGYKNTDVSVRVEPDQTREDAVDVFITIDERERIEIKDLDLRGNTHLNETLLSFQLTNAPGFLFFNNYYDEALLDDDIAILRSKYYNAGFLDATVRRGDFIYDEEKQKVSIILDVDQGPRYRISEVATEGVTYFNADEIEEITETLEGKTFSGTRLERVLERVRTLYGNQGYVDTEVSYRLDKDPESRTARTILTAQESDVSYVGEVRVDMEDYEYETDLNAFNRFMGWLSPPTKENTVRRELRLKSGEKYRTADEVRTVERLRNLGIFRKVEVERVPTADPQVKDAVVKVEEDPNAAFIGLSAGVGEVSGPNIGINAVQPNFRGNADRISAGAMLGTRNSEYRAGYFDRYLGESDTSMQASIYRSTERLRAYRQRTYGSEVEFGRPLTERLNGYLRFRGEHVAFNDVKKGIDEDLSSYPVFAVRPMLAYDQRDNRAWPTRGYLVTGGFETGYADGALLKFLHALEYYYNIPKTKFIYAYGHTVGVQPYDAQQVGITERFFVGGTNSLRGFQYREVGPRDSGDSSLATGGATRITQRHELRYPFNEYLKGRIFTDAAILERGPLEVGTPRVGSGAGVIIDFGPVLVEIDLAAPVVKQRHDRPQFFHLRIGSEF